MIILDIGQVHVKKYCTNKCFSAILVPYYLKTCLKINLSPTEMEGPDSDIMQKEVDWKDLFDPQGTVCLCIYGYDLVLA